MSHRNGILFLNPRAGTFSPADESAIRTLAYENGLRVIDIHPEIDVRKVVREALDAGLKTFVVAGGDGSLHHVAQGLVNTDGVLGVVPIGSVNHLARDLDIPIDVGRVNGRYFMNSVMLGIYPTISAFRERFRSMHSRWRAYAKAFRLALRHFPHVTLVVELDGRVETFRTQMFVIAVNSYDLTQTGVVSPKTHFNDGRVSIYSLSFMSRMQFVVAAAKYFRGKVFETPGFRSIRTTQMSVDTGKRHLRISVDGELMDLDTPLQIAVVPSSLLVRAPAGE
jgi:diacylglycerol kinase family enzyme